MHSDQTDQTVTQSVSQSVSQSGQIRLSFDPSGVDLATPEYPELNLVPAVSWGKSGIVISAGQQVTLYEP